MSAVEHDNALHRPPLPAREHKHTADEIIMLLPPSLEQVIDEILAKRDSFGAK